MLNKRYIWLSNWYYGKNKEGGGGRIPPWGRSQYSGDGGHRSPRGGGHSGQPLERGGGDGRPPQYEFVPVSTMFVLKFAYQSA